MSSGKWLKFPIKVARSFGFNCSSETRINSSFHKSRAPIKSRKLFYCTLIAAAADAEKINICAMHFPMKTLAKFNRVWENMKRETPRNSKPFVTFNVFLMIRDLFAVLAGKIKWSLKRFRPRIALRFLIGWRLSIVDLKSDVWWSSAPQFELPDGRVIEIFWDLSPREVEDGNYRHHKVIRRRNYDDNDGKKAKPQKDFSFLFVSSCSPHAAECCCGRNCAILEKKRRENCGARHKAAIWRRCVVKCVRQMPRSSKRHATIASELRWFNREKSWRFSHEARKLHLIRSSQAPLDVTPACILAASSIIIDVHRVYFSFLLLLLPKSNRFSGHLKTLRSLGGAFNHCEKFFESFSIGDNDDAATCVHRGPMQPVPVSEVMDRHILWPIYSLLWLVALLLEILSISCVLIELTILQKHFSAFDERNFSWIRNVQRTLFEICYEQKWVTNVVK